MVFSLGERIRDCQLGPMSIFYPKQNTFLIVDILIKSSYFFFLQIRGWINVGPISDILEWEHCLKGRLVWWRIISLVPQHVVHVYARLLSAASRKYGQPVILGHGRKSILDLTDSVLYNLFDNSLTCSITTENLLGAYSWTVDISIRICNIGMEESIVFPNE